MAKFIEIHSGNPAIIINIDHIEAIERSTSTTGITDYYAITGSTRYLMDEAGWERFTSALEKM